MTADNEHRKFMMLAIELGRKGLRNDHGGPFGAVVVKHGKVIGKGWNQVLLDNDPTAHAEIMAIRNACRTIGHFQLDECIIYTSCEPCPMCLGAIYWARPEKLFYACSKEDAARAEFDDDFIYKEFTLPRGTRKLTTHQICRDEAMALFREWDQKEDKHVY